MGCAPLEAPLSVSLTDNDRKPVADPAKPNLPAKIAPLAATPKAEREYMWDTYVAPLMDFSIQQEATTQSERQRANGVVAKVDAAQKPKRPWWRIR